MSRPFPVLSGHVSSQDGAEAQLATRFAAYLAERPALDAWFARVGELAEVSKLQGEIDELDREIAESKAEGVALLEQVKEEVKLQAKKLIES